MAENIEEEVAVENGPGKRAEVALGVLKGYDPNRYGTWNTEDLTRYVKQSPNGARAVLLNLIDSDEFEDLPGDEFELQKSFDGLPFRKQSDKKVEPVAEVKQPVAPDLVDLPSDVSGGARKIITQAGLNEQVQQNGSVGVIPNATKNPAMGFQEQVTDPERLKDMELADSEMKSQKRGYTNWAKDLTKQTGDLFSNIFRKTEQGLMHLTDFVPRNLNELRKGTKEYDEAWERHNKSFERLYEANSVIDKDFEAASKANNIETSVIDAFKNGTYHRLPEATLYNVAQGAMQIIPTLMTGGASMLAQTIPATYSAGVDKIAKETNRTPEQVIQSGDDARLIAGISSSFQTLLENAGAGMVSAAIATQGGYRFIRNWVLAKTGSKALARAAGLTYSSTGEAGTEWAQELTAITGEEASTAKNSKQFLQKLAAAITSEEGLKRQGESAVGGFIGGGGVVGGGRVASAIGDQLSQSTTPDLSGIGNGLEEAQIPIQQQPGQAQPQQAGPPPQDTSEESEVSQEEFDQFRLDHKISDERFNGMVDDFIEGKTPDQFDQNYQTMYGMFREQIEEAGNKIKAAMGDEETDTDTQIQSGESQTGVDGTQGTGIRPVMGDGGSTVDANGGSQGTEEIVPVAEEYVEPVTKEEVGSGVEQSTVDAIGRISKAESGFSKDLRNEAFQLFSDIQKADDFNEQYQLLNDASPELRKAIHQNDTKTQLAEAEKQTATHPENDIPHPTQAQIEAGNYQKGKVNIQGLEISIENPKGSERKGVDADGKPWSVTMNNTYGYIKGTEGADGEQHDVFIGPNPESEKVFVIDQVHPDGKFDEHKVMIGFGSAATAQIGYNKNYSPDWKGFGAITEMTMPEFKEWLKTEDQTNPVGELEPVKKKDSGSSETAKTTGPKPTFSKGTAETFGFTPIEKGASKFVFSSNKSPDAYDVFKLKISDDGQFATFETDPSLKRGLNDLEADLGRAFRFAEVSKKAGGSGFETVNPGTAKKNSDGSWTVTKKAQVNVYGRNPNDEQPTFTKRPVSFEEAKPESELDKIKKVADESDGRIVVVKPEPIEKKEEPKEPTKQEKRAERDTELDEELSGLFDEFKKAGTTDLNKLSMNPLPSEQLAVGLKIMAVYAKKKVYKFSDIVEDSAKYLGDRVGEYLDALKAVYLSYQGSVSDEVLDQMDDVKTVRNFKIESQPEEKETQAEPDNDLTSEDIEFMAALRKKMNDGEKVGIVTMRKMYPGKEDTDLQELAELELVRMSRAAAKIAGEDTAMGLGIIEKMYDAQPTISMRSSERIALQQYSTPIPFAYLASDFVASAKPELSLEPNAGNGALTISLNPKKVVVNEIDKSRLKSLNSQGFKEITTQDALEPFGKKKYDGVVMNPPFGSSPEVTIDGYKIQGLDPKMIINALDAMKDDGVASLITGGHNKYDELGRLSTNRTFFNYLYNHYNVLDVINVDGQLYAKQGTTFPTRLILIAGRKATPDGAAPLKSEEKNAVITSYPDLLNRIQNAKDFVLQSKLDAQQQRGQNDDGGTDTGTEGQSQETGRPNPISEGTVYPVGDGANRPGGTTGSQSGGSSQTQPGGRTEGQQPGGSSGQSIRPGSNAGGNQSVSGSELGGRGETTSTNPTTGKGDVQRNEPNRDLRESDVDITQDKTDYISASGGRSVGTVQPTAQAAETRRVLSEIQDRVGNIDDFVTKELDYSNREALYKSLSAEQIDAVAMAIDQFTRGSGIIIGDMTGVGKGRIAAAMLRYAHLKGMKPVFLTEKSDLFSDMYRDMKAIGSAKMVPFIFNDDAKAKITEEKADGDLETIYKLTPKEAFRAGIEAQGMPEGYDYAMATYSQFNNARAAQKRELMQLFSNNSLLIMDESHNSSGPESNIGTYLRGVVANSKSTVFLSATFAKRPDNMPIYGLKTAIQDAGLSNDELIHAIKRGGVPLQEIISTQLVESGQMIRREREFEGVEMNFTTLDDPATEKDHRQKADAVIQIFRDIIEFQNLFVKPAIERLDEQAAAEGERIGATAGTNEAGVSNTPFASKIFNAVSQLLFALKAQDVAHEAVRELKAGRKVVIGFQNTMESFFTDMGYTDGDVIANLDFSQSLIRGLRATLRYTQTDAMGIKIPGQLTPEQLGVPGKVAYYALMRKIEKASSGILLSPIDAMTNIIEEAGFSVGEITGRKNKLRIHEDGSATLEKRKERDKKSIVSKFNNGQMDAVMLNASGSTGISMHASETVSDRRQRVMLVVQAPLDVNTFIQMMGRIDRTGQVVRGAYNIISSSIPAEKRLAMMLARKVKSLFANSSGKQKAGSVNIDVVDFTNKYGDEIMTQYLAEHPTINERILDPLKISGMSEEDVITTSYSVEDGADKALRKVALLLSGEQDKFYKEVTERYEAYMDYLNSNDANDLEVKILPLNAKTLETTVLQEGSGTNSPFGQSAFLNKMEVAVLKKPLPAVQVEKRINESLDGLTPEEYSSNLVAEIEKYYDSRVESTEAENAKTLNEKIEKERKGIEADREIDETFGDGAAQERQSRIEAITAALKEEYDVRNQHAEERNARVKVQLTSRARQFKVGTMYEVPIDVDVKPETPTVRGVLVDFKVNKKASNPYAPSNITLLFATQDSRQLVKIPASKERFLTQAYIKSQSKGIAPFEKGREEWDKKQLAGSNTEIRYVVTGNILMGYGVRPGQLITFTTDTGKVKKGILYPKDFIGEGEGGVRTRIPISRALPVINRSRQGVTTTNGDIMLRTSNQGYSISVPAVRLRGGKYFLDPILRAFVEGENFRQSSDRMVATINSDNIQPALDYLTSNFGLFVESDEVAKPIEIVEETQSLSDRAIDIIDKAIEDINSGTNAAFLPGVPQLIKGALKVFRAAIVAAKAAHPLGKLTADAVRKAKKKALDWIKAQTDKTAEAITKAAEEFEKLVTPLEPAKMGSNIREQYKELEDSILAQVSGAIDNQIAKATTEAGIKAGRNEVKNVLRTIFKGMKTQLSAGQLGTIMAKVPKTNSLKALANFVFTAANVVHQGEQHDALDGMKKAALKILGASFTTQQDKNALIPLLKALDVDGLSGDAIPRFADYMVEIGATRLGKELRSTNRDAMARWFKNQIDEMAEAKERIRERILQNRYEKAIEDGTIADDVSLEEFRQFLKGRSILSNQQRSAKAQAKNDEIKSELQDTIPLLLDLATQDFNDGTWGSTEIVGRALKAIKTLKIGSLSVPELRQLHNILADYIDTGNFSMLGVFAATADADKAIKEIAPYADQFRTVTGVLVKKNFSNLAGSITKVQATADKLRETLFQRAQSNFVKTIRKAQNAVKSIEDFAAEKKFTERQIRTVEVYNILRQSYTQGNTWQEWRDRMVEQYEKYIQTKKSEARDIKTWDWKSLFKNAYEEQVRNAEETLEVLKSFDNLPDLEAGITPDQKEYHNLIVDAYRAELQAFKDSSMAYYGIEVPEGNNSYVPLNPIYRFPGGSEHGQGDVLDTEDLDTDIINPQFELHQINTKEAGTTIKRTPFIKNDVVYGTDLIANFSKRFFQTAYQNQMSHDLFVMSRLLNSPKFREIISAEGSTVNIEALKQIMKGTIASERLSGHMAIDRRSFMKRVSGGSLASAIVSIWQTPKQAIGVFPMIGRVPGEIFGKAFKLGVKPTEAVNKFLENTTLLLRTDYQSESDVNKRHRRMNEFGGKTRIAQALHKIGDTRTDIADFNAKTFVGHADRFVSRAGLLGGYIYSLQQQGYNIDEIDWNAEAENPNMLALSAGENLSEILNNTSDQTSKAEVLKTQKNDTEVSAREANWMLASFDLNAFQDLYNNWRTLSNRDSTGDQRKEAFAHIVSQASNSLLYQSMAMLQWITEGVVIEMAMGAALHGDYEPPDEEEFWRIFKNQLWIRGISGPFSLLIGGVGNLGKILYRYGADIGFSFFQDEEENGENKGSIWSPKNGLFYNSKDLPFIEMVTHLAERLKKSTGGKAEDQIMLIATLASFYAGISDPERITNKVLRETEKSEKRRDKKIDEVKYLDKNPAERKSAEHKMWEYLKEGKESSAQRLFERVKSNDDQETVNRLFEYVIEDHAKKGIIGDVSPWLNLAYGLSDNEPLTVQYPQAEGGVATKWYSDILADGKIKPGYLQTVRKRYEQQAEDQKKMAAFILKNYPKYVGLKEWLEENLGPNGYYEPLADRWKRAVKEQDK